MILAAALLAASCAQYVTGTDAHGRCVNARRDCAIYTTDSAAYRACNAADRPVYSDPKSTDRQRASDRHERLGERRSKPAQ